MTYGAPITIPGAYSLGLVAYNAWCEAHLDEPVVDWMDPHPAERGSDDEGHRWVPVEP